MYMEKARTMRAGGSIAPDAELRGAAAARPGKSGSPAMRLPPDGTVAVSWANCQTSRGCQKRSNTASDPMETSAARMSVSSGPTKFDTRNWTIAKDTPVTRTAGRIWVIFFQPAMTVIR